MTAGPQGALTPALGVRRGGNRPERPARILLVEDHPDLATLVKHTLTRALDDPIVHHAATSGEALRHLGIEGEEPIETPDLILLDLKLPGIGGHGILEAIRSDERVCHVPVVVLSSSPDPKDRRLAYEMGANSFVAKPVAFHQLKRTVDQVLEYWLGVDQGPPEPA